MAQKRNTKGANSKPAPKGRKPKVKIEELPPIQDKYLFSESLRRRLSVFLHKSNLQVTQDEEKLLKKYYQETFRDNPDWSCKRCLARCVVKICESIGVS